MRSVDLHPVCTHKVLKRIRSLCVPVVIAAHLLFVSIACAQQQGFPYKLPSTEPNRPLSAAMKRNYRNNLAPTPEQNELYSLFKYTELEGFDYNGHDGTVTRRDPSKVILHDVRYYVWYTRRATEVPPVGPDNATAKIPARDWDLSEIWYATSKDGFRWQEQGVAVKRPPRPNAGWRSVSTPDILVWKGKYYLYYQAFSVHPSSAGDNCPVSVAVSESPDGPWQAVNQVVIPNGDPDEWDGYSIHDPYPLVYKDQIYLYYKSDCNGKDDIIRMQGVAIADNPLGPFEKHPLNPVLNSGHETTLFPFKQGIAALVIKDGNEHFTVQYAPDGINFEIAAITELMPVAAGPYVPDAFAGTEDGRGITWGLCHNTHLPGHSILMRFDCDLSRDVHYPEMKRHHVRLKPEHYYRHGLTSDRLRQLKTENTDVSREE